MRVHIGPGYRVYFSRRAKVVYLLLVGGDKTPSSLIAHMVRVPTSVQRQHPVSVEYSQPTVMSACSIMPAYA